MGSSSDRPTDAGFATPAATMVSLGLAMVASAVTTMSVMELRQARADQARVAAEYALDGAQQQAALTLLTTRQAARLQWTETTSLGPVRVLAEFEPGKLGLAAASELDDAALGRFGVTDAHALQARLKAFASAQPADFDIGQADQSRVWRACARSAISRYGEGKVISSTAAVAPVDQGEVSWRIGEVWRLRISGGGWVDDRIVRFTGDPTHPAAVVERQVARGAGDDRACDRPFADGLWS